MRTPCKLPIQLRKVQPHQKPTSTEMLQAVDQQKKTKKSHSEQAAMRTRRWMMRATKATIWHTSLSRLMMAL